MMRITLTTRGLDFKRQAAMASSLPPMDESSLSTTHLRAFRSRNLSEEPLVESLLRTAMVLSPPVQLRIRHPHISLSPEFQRKYSSTGKESATARIGAKSYLPPEFTRTSARLYTTLKGFLTPQRSRLQASNIIAKSLRADKMRLKQIEVVKQRNEFASRRRRRLNSLPFANVAALADNKEGQLDLKDLAKMEGPPQPASLINSPTSRERFRRRIAALHSKFAAEWRRSDRLGTLSTPIRGVVSLPYYRLKPLLPRELERCDPLKPVHHN